jgi:hypothetical protein
MESDIWTLCLIASLLEYTGIPSLQFIERQNPTIEKSTPSTYRFPECLNIVLYSQWF